MAFSPLGPLVALAVYNALVMCTFGYDKWQASRVDSGSGER